MSDNLEHNNAYKNIKRLSDEELIKLWNLYLADKSNKKYRDMLILQYIYLTKYVIGRIKLSLPANFALDDITSFGVEGLIDAIEKYSPARGAHFETYAVMRIRGAIIDKIRLQDWLPRTTRKKIKDIKKAAEELKQQFGRSPSTDEIADYLGVDKEKITAILFEDTSITSLYDKKYSDEESVELIDTLVDTKAVSPLQKLEERDVRNELQEALMKLPRTGYYET